MRFAIAALSAIIAVSSWSNEVETFSTVASFAGRTQQIINSVENDDVCAFVRNSGSSNTALFAKKKGKVNNAKLAALEALEALEETTGANGVNGGAAVESLPWDDDEPLSKKDALKAKKKAAKQAKKNNKAAAAQDFDFDMDEPMSAKEKAEMEKKAKKMAKKEAVAEAPPTGKKDPKAAALKALEEMERMEAEAAAAAAIGGDAAQPKLSKKEMKQAAKKAEKEAAKKAAKEAKKAAKRAELEESQDEVCQITFYFIMIYYRVYYIMDLGISHFISILSYLTLVQHCKYNQSF